MKAKLLAALIIFSVEAIAAECSIEGSWVIDQADTSAVPVTLGVGNTIDLRLAMETVTGSHLQVYYLEQGGESFMCETVGVDDGRDMLPAGLAVGSFPYINCAFVSSGELMRFSAVLVKDGTSAASRCANGFFGHNPTHAFFDGDAATLDDTCYSSNACVIYWRVETNENNGQGTGSNDGGSTS